MLFDVQDLDNVIAHAANPNGLENRQGGCCRSLFQDVAGVSDLRTLVGKRGRNSLLSPSGRTRPMNAGGLSTQVITSHPGDYTAYLLPQEHQPFQDLAL
jgi:hypothetical protein